MQIENYYTKYGVVTLLIGRFIPFGVRNCLFVTAGIGKMRFWKFISQMASPVLLQTQLFFC